MNVALWIATGVLAALFLLTGLMKLTRSRAQLAASGQGYVDDLTDGTVKLIGAAEVLAALGLVLPAVAPSASALTSLAASGLMVLMVGAALTHWRRGETQSIAVNVALFAIAAFVAVGRIVTDVP